MARLTTNPASAAVAMSPDISKEPPSKTKWVERRPDGFKETYLKIKFLFPIT
jgi:hypothetical protein